MASTSLQLKEGILRLMPRVTKYEVQLLRFYSTLSSSGNIQAVTNQQRTILRFHYLPSGTVVQSPSVPIVPLVSCPLLNETAHNTHAISLPSPSLPTCTLYITLWLYTLTIHRTTNNSIVTQPRGYTIEEQLQHAAPNTSRARAIANFGLEAATFMRHGHYLVYSA